MAKRHRAEQATPDSAASRSGRDRGARLMIAGGGTGGHLFPGIAVAEAFMAQNPRNRVVFVSTGNALERAVLSRKGFALERISVEGIKRRGTVRQIRALARLPLAIWQALRLIGRFRPHILLGVGSYAAGPAAVAAWLRGVPIVLHEQNILPGLTNRLTGRMADRIYVSFDQTRGRFSPAKTVVTGNPVRREILRCALPAPDPKRPFTVAVIGGSQGAHPINRAVADALPHLSRQGLAFVHQTGAADRDEMRQAYQDHGISARVGAFFNDMAAVYRQADLVVCRAGATTVAEVTAVGKAVIFIPYPFAADNHQEFNARSLADAGAAEMILEKTLTGARLAERIKRYAAAPDRLAAMAGRCRDLGRPQAAAAIVADCLGLVGPAGG